jgi:methylaspartate mutase epsilon subunit
MDIINYKLRNKKIDEDEFQSERQEVLSQWPTGREVDLDEAIEFQKSLSPGQVLPLKLEIARQRGEAWPITGMGKATLEQQSEIWHYVQDAGQAELLGTSVDSFSRILDFAASEKGIQESLRMGKSVLNGLPVVNHGIKKLRQAIQSLNVPIMMRYGAVDPRLIDEIGIAGGHTCTAPDGIYSFWNMNSKFPLEKSLRIHQYIMRLIGHYEEKGAPILLTSQGMYDGGALPPSLVSAALLTQVLMYAEQGVKHIAIHYHLRGNLVQDVAATAAVQKLAHEYLQRFGYSDIKIFLTAGLALLRYPDEPGSSFAIICANSLGTKMCGAQLNDIRTPAEAVTIPTKEDIAMSFRCARMITALLKDQKIEINPRAVEIESAEDEREIRLILDKVLELGEGDIAIGTVRAVQTGVLDNPFSTNSMTACKVLGVKDSDGAVRYLETGNLPFTKDILDFHRQKIADRAKKRGQEIDYETVIEDMTSISHGYLVA